MGEPISPFSGKPFAECDDRERDAWIWTLLNPDTVVVCVKGSELRERKKWSAINDDAWYIGGSGGIVPRYTRVTCLGELLESELWPVGWAVRKLRSGEGVVYLVENKEGQYVTFSANLSAAVVEAIIRAAWEREHRFDEDEGFMPGEFKRGSNALRGEGMEVPE